MNCFVHQRQSIIELKMATGRGGGVKLFFNIFEKYEITQRQHVTESVIMEE